MSRKGIFVDMMTRRVRKDFIAKNVINVLSD